MRGIIESTQQAAYKAINTTLVQRNWLIGYRIAEEELQGEARSEYGLQIIKSLSKELTGLYGKGYDRSNLYHCLRFYKMFPEIVDTVCRQSENLLSWSHYRALLQVEDEKARAWYEKEALTQTWGVRTLQRNISSQYYYRMLQTQRKDLVENEMKELTAEYQNDKLEFIKNPVVAEFLGLSSNTDFTESDLEKSILSNLQKFLMELGKGYAFVARQQRIVFIAENENEIHVKKIPATVHDITIKTPVEYVEKKRNILILRYSSKIETIIHELRVINKDASITIAVKEEYLEEIESIKDRNQDMNIEVVCEKGLENREIKNLIDKTKPDSIIVLSNIDMSYADTDEETCGILSEKDDSEIIILLLQLRSLAQKENYNFSVTSEIRYSSNQKLAQDTGVNDFVVGSSITNRLLAQIAQEKDRYEIFQDLITTEGMDVLIRNVSDYLEVDKPYKLSQVKRCVALSGNKKEVFIGYMRSENSKYRSMDKGCLFNISRMNPQDAGEDFYFDENDALIVLGDSI